MRKNENQQVLNCAEATGDNIENCFSTMFPFPKFYQIVAVFFFCLCIYHSNLDDINQFDTVPAPYVAWSFVHEHNFDLNEHVPLLQKYCGSVIVRGPRGHWVSKFPVGSAIMAIPHYAVCSLFVDNIPKKTRMLRLGKLVAATYCALATAIFFIITSLLFGKSSFLITGLFGFGTTVYSTGSQALWAHGPAVFWVCSALYFLLIFRNSSLCRQGIFAGLSLGMGVLCRPTVGILLATFVVCFIFYKKTKLALGIVLGSILPVGFLIVYNFFYTGYIFSGGYGAEDHAWSTPLYIGLAGLTISPSKGLFFYTPAVAIAVYGIVKFISHSKTIPQSQRHVLFAGLLGAIFTTIFYAKWHHWMAGWSYGPRFLTEIMPIVCLFFGIGYKYLTSKWTRILAILLVCLSIAVHFVGVFADDGAWNSRHFTAFHTLNFFQFQDNQILSSFIEVVRWLLGLFA